MEELNIEGEWKSLSEKQLSFIKDVLVKRGYVNKKVVVKPVGIKGDNYVATVLRICVEDGHDGTIFNMIAKVSSTVEALRTQMNLDAMFANEILMYNEVLPKFNELQVAAAIPECERIRFPVCYGTLDEEPYELILLEDLSESGFAIFNRMKPFSEQAINLALKNLAMFHTLSFVLKHKEPQKFDSYKDGLLNMYEVMKKTPGIEVYFNMLENDILQVLDEDKHKNEIKKVVSETAKISSDLDARLKSSVPKYSVILQGDCWGNNIMFKLDKSEPVSAVLIDYQVSREASPVLDLFYLLFNCSSYDTPSERMKKWFDLYYTELDIFLCKFGLDVATVYPREKFDSDLKVHAKLGLAQKCLLATILVREGNEVFDIQDAVAFDLADAEKAMEAFSMSKTANETQNRFKKTIIGVIDNLLELSYL